MTAPQPPAPPSTSKASLQKVKAQPNGSADKPATLLPDGPPIYVQFNPTSLKLDRNNNTSTGSITQAQRRQQTNEGHATLSVELIFDTAETGSNGKFADVRVLTQQLRQFVEPNPARPKDAPPSLRFTWGPFTFSGIVSHIGEELDYFASDGTALRAKVSLSITQQDEKLAANLTGPGSRDATSATPPDPKGSATGPGAAPTGNPNQTVAAQAGESVQQALSRLGADPSTWRSAMAGLDSPLDLAAGTELQLNTAITAGGGIGVSAGFSAGASIGVDAGSAATGAGSVAGFGSASGGAAVTVAAGAGAGFAFSAQGGLAAAAGQAQVQAQAAAAADARAAFTSSAGVTVSASASASASAGAVASAAEAGALSRTVAAVAAATVDPRAQGFGRGVPLRPRPTPLGGRPATQA